MEMPSWLINEVNRNYSLKPTVRMGSYFFKWSDKDYGICPSESSVFKNFIRKMIPLLEYYTNVLNFEHKDNSQKNLHKDKKHQICIIENYNSNVSFIMLIDGEGSTVFYREEKFHIRPREFENLEVRDHNSFVLQTRNNIMANTNIVSLKWLLGELLFDRVKTAN
jgi:hypothetical protein